MTKAPHPFFFRGCLTLPGLPPTPDRGCQVHPTWISIQSWRLISSVWSPGMMRSSRDGQLPLEMKISSFKRSSLSNILDLSFSWAPFPNPVCLKLGLEFYEDLLSIIGSMILTLTLFSRITIHVIPLHLFGSLASCWSKPQPCLYHNLCNRSSVDEQFSCF